MDGDGDLDIVSGGKAGLFLAENLTKSPKRPPVPLITRLSRIEQLSQANL